MKRLLWLVPAALGFGAALALGAAFGWFAHGPRPDTGSYAVNRLGAIRQHLAEAEPGYLLIAGDSQAELQSPSERVCGASLVNAGISGATAALYAELLADLSVPVRPGAAVLTIGTNDILRKNDPLSPEAAQGFEEKVGAIVARLRQFSDRVVVTALPPLGRERAEEFEPRAVGAYSERIRALCARAGCLYADPFAPLRDGDSGFGLPGANRDGLHLARYRPVLKALAATLCPDDARP